MLEKDVQPSCCAHLLRRVHRLRRVRREGEGRLVLRAELQRGARPAMDVALGRAPEASGTVGLSWVVFRGNLGRLVTKQYQQDHPGSGGFRPHHNFRLIFIFRAMRYNTRCRYGKL